MPGVEVEEGHEEVNADRGAGRDDEVGEDVVAEDERGEGVFELNDYNVDRGKGSIGHDDGVDNHRGHEHLLGPEEMRH